MASKRETLHLKKNPDFPPNPPAEEEAFDPSKARHTANETLDDLKKELYAAGIAPSRVSTLWQQARLTHEKILDSLSAYRNETDPKEKATLIATIRQETATLKDESAEDLREARQFLAQSTMKEQGIFTRDKTVLTPRFDETFQAYTKSESLAYAMKQEAENVRTEDAANESGAVPEPIETPVQEHTEPAERPAEHVAEAEVETEAETEENKPDIVMVNPVLTKIAMGGKTMKKPKEPKPKKAKKSVSEGGTVYKGMVFSEREPGMAEAVDAVAKEEAIDAGPEAPIIRGTPETHAEYKSVLRRSLEQIENDIQAKKKIVESLEMAADRHARGIGVHETAAFQAHNGGKVAESAEEKLLRAERELKKLYKERDAPEAEEVEVPIVPEDDSVMEAHSYAPNVIDLAAKRKERDERMQKQQARKKQNFFRAALASLFGLSAAAGTPDEKTPAPERHSPPPASSHAPGAATRLEPASHPIQGLHQNAISPRSAPNPIILQRQQHATEMARHHASNPRAEAVARSHHASSVDPDRSEEIAAIYAKELRDHGLPPHTDPENFTAFRAEIQKEIRAKKEVPAVAAPAAPIPAERPAPPAEAQPAPRAEQPTPVAPAEKHEVPAPAAQAPATHEAPASTARESKNIHGLSIDKSAAHMYEDANGKLIVYGGTNKKQLELVNSFLAQKENFGKTIIMMTDSPDPLTGQPDVSEYRTDSSGTVEFTPVVADERNMPILPPTDDDLVKLMR